MIRNNPLNNTINLESDNYRDIFTIRIRLHNNRCCYNDTVPVQILIENNSFKEVCFASVSLHFKVADMDISFTDLNSEQFWALEDRSEQQHDSSVVSSNGLNTNLRIKPGQKLVLNGEINAIIKGNIKVNSLDKFYMILILSCLKLEFLKTIIFCSWKK